MDEQDLTRLLRPRGWHDPERTWRCLSAEQLAAYADGRLTSQEHDHLLAHLADCDYCVREVAALAHLQDSLAADVPPSLLVRARELAESEATGLGKLSWGWTTAAAVAAGVVVVAGLLVDRPGKAVEMQGSEVPVAVRPLPQGNAAPPTGRATPEVAPGAQADGNVRNRSTHASVPALLFPLEGAVVDAADVQLRWKAVPEALFYDVRVLSAEGDLLWEQRVDGTQVQMPPSTLAQGQSRMFVTVRAHLPGGGTPKSPVVGFSVRRVE